MHGLLNAAERRKPPGDVTSGRHGEKHVYLVMGYVNYESTDVLSVYDNEEAAEAYKAMREKQQQKLYDGFYVHKLPILSTPQTPKTAYKVWMMGWAPDKIQEVKRETETMWPDATGDYRASEFGERAWVDGKWGRLCQVVGRSERGFGEAEQLALNLLERVFGDVITRV